MSNIRNGLWRMTRTAGLLSGPMLALIFTVACSDVAGPFGRGETSPDPALSFTTSQRPVYSAGDLVSLIFSGSHAENSSAPSYADIEFFPVTSAGQLASLIPPFARDQGGADAISAIDFDTQFALVVAHPSMTQMPGNPVFGGTPGIYFSTPRARYKSDEIVIKLDAKRLGGNDVGLGMLVGRWDSNVYVFDRKGKETLRVQLYDDDYRFALTTTDDDATRAEDVIDPATQ